MPNEANERLDSAETLAGSSVERTQWQKLEELAARDDFESILKKELPRALPVLTRSGMDRRTFLKIMGASLVMSGLSGCAAQPPTDPIIPYVRVPEMVVPGKPLFFTTATSLGGFGAGVLLETHEGRPTRVEGNPEHPASLGGANPFLLASILELYNPDRSTLVRQNRELRSWENFLGAFAAASPSFLADGGAGLRILTETVTSPTLASQLDALAGIYPNARWYQYEPISQDNVIAGSQLAFGEVVNSVYHFENARVVLSLDADFLTTSPGSLRYARDFMDQRRVREGAEMGMNRLYVVESALTNTGAIADHRLPLRASQVELFARTLAAALGVDAGPVPAATWDSGWLDALAENLKANAGASLIVAGAEQPPAVHALVHAMNAALNNIGSTVIYTPSVIANPVVQSGQLQELAAEMAAGTVQGLFIIGGNPAYTAPVDLAFADALMQVPFTVHLSMYLDETSTRCTWHLPQTHYIEEWSDVLAFDGSASIVQPPIGPLYEEVRSAHEILALLIEDGRSGYEIVRGHWEAQYSGDNFEAFWRQALQDGVVPNTAFAAVTPTLNADLGQQLPAAPTPLSGLEVVFRPDPSVWDGRFAGNSWLQEVPNPITTITWDNVAMISPATARTLGVDNGNLVTLRFRGNTVAAPIWVMRGIPNDAVVVTLGYGRTEGSQVGQGLGFNAYAIRPSDALWFGAGVEVLPLGRQYEIATTQTHYPMTVGEHPPVLTGTLNQFRQDTHFAHESEAKGLLPEWKYDGYAWGMVVDLTACVGCNACVIACQTENNIPSVGKEQVAIGREMHWIRIDSYLDDDVDNPKVNFQPVNCMHCELAPCELVCPVEATVHSNEGLNQMVYNRCIGTRYCSNNCPYKVRRFNFLNFYEEEPILQEFRNPDVTVRSRGVMEKCTYCVQRINEAHIASKKEDRPIFDGEVVPACASACPTQAIVFGDINDSSTQVAQMRSQPHQYGLLAHLNTKPRTTYLARIYNPNEALDENAGV